MAIARKDRDTDVLELVGHMCEQFVVLPADDEIAMFYARIDGTWHRFCVDDGLLCWHEGSRPDSEEDADGEQSYADLAAELNLFGASFTTIGFHAGRLELSFSNGAQLVCGKGVRGAKVLEKTRGKLGASRRAR